MSWGMIVVGAATAIKAGVDIHAKNKAARRASKLASGAQAEEDIQRAKLEKQMQEYKSQKFVNPYANMENVYEDLTVNQQQAQFQAQQGRQQRANIMQQMKGAAGSSGIAALAQSMAGQGQLQTQRISVSIGQQEAANQRARARGAAQIQLSERQGEAMVQSAEMGRTKTLLGMQQGDTAAAMQFANQAEAQQMQAQNAVTQAWATGIGDVATSVAGAYGGRPARKIDPNITPVESLGTGGFNPGGTGGFGGTATDLGGTSGSLYDDSWKVDWRNSDRRLKKNIKKISKSPNGLNIYSFEFKDSKYGEGVFQGVMSDEVPKKAVINKDGYDMVDYSKLDVEFKQI